MKFSQFKILVLIITLVLFSNCAFTDNFNGDIGKSIEFVKNAKEGTEKKKISHNVTLSSGCVANQYWVELSSVLAQKKNAVFYFDFSKLKAGEGEKDCEIPEKLFSSTECLGGMILPAGITEIRYQCFMDCKNLEYFYFPENNIDYIGAKVLNNCHNLKKVHIGEFTGRLSYCFNSTGNQMILEMPDHPIYCDTSNALFSDSSISQVVTPSRNYTFSEWMQRNKVMEPHYVKIREVHASSQSSEKYSAKNIASGSYLSWIEGKADDGIGEWIEVIFEEPTTISGFSIKNGFGNLAYFWENNRVKNAHIILDDDEENSVAITLDDTPVAQYGYLGAYKKPYSKMKLVIDSIYPGTNADRDTCLAEICVNASMEREEIYGAYYTDSSVSYLYDPETKRMLRGMYEIDVGKGNVREDTNGFLLVQASNWEDGSTYWTRPSGCLYGTQYHDFYPGTGGGSSKYHYKILLQPNGRHILFMYYTQFFGSFEYYDSKVHVYVWESQSWKDISAGWNEPVLAPLNELRKLIHSRGFVYNFYINNNSYDSDNGIIFTVYEKLFPNFRFSVRFSIDDFTISDYDKTVETVAAFGKPEDFKNNQPLLEDLKSSLNTLNSSYEIQSPLNIAASINPAPAMCQYLIDFGFPVIETGYDRHYKRSALEAWKNGNNNNQVRDVLLKNGVSYSSQMLIDAVKHEDKKAFSELFEFVTDLDPLWNYLVHDFMNDFDNVYNLESLKYYLAELQKAGFDIHKQRIDENGHGRSGIMEQAIEVLLPDAVKYLHSIGFDFPEELDSFDGDTPIEYCVNLYIKNATDMDEEDSDHYRKRYKNTVKNAKEILMYLLKNGDDVNGIYDKPLHIIAENGQYINKYGLEMARLMLEYGADVNKIDGNNLNPLGLLAKESHFYEKEYTKETVEFVTLLLAKGCNAENILLSCFYDDTPAVYLGMSNDDGWFSNQYKADFFEKYLALCKGRNIKIWNKDKTALEESSLINEVIKKYMQNSESYCDRMVLKLLDSGFTFVKSEYPLLAHMINSFGYKLDDTKRIIIKKYFEQVNNSDNYQKDVALYYIIYSFVQYGYIYDIPEYIDLLLSNGANIKYEIKDESSRKKGATAVDVLLLPKEIDFSSERMTDAFINICKLFINYGGEGLITEASLKKAKVPGKVIKLIF